MTLKIIRMKKVLASLVFCSIFLAGMAQQKYAFVETSYILENMPEYAEAQTALNAASEEWQNEIEKRYESIERLYKAYQAEAVLLTDEMKAKREEEIVRKEKEAKELQKQRFGVKGDLFKKRQELIQPIQERVFEAIREYAVEGGYTAVLDKSSQSGVLYVNSKYDKSDKILRKMGIRPGEFQKTESEKTDSSSGGSDIKKDIPVERK
jgi:outer membrane protein